MKEAAAKLEFEKAASLRDKIVALEKTMERQVISAAHHRDQDVFALSRREEAAAVAVLLVRDGVISGQHTYFIPNPLEDDHDLLAEVLARFYERHPVPGEILLPAAPDGRQSLEEWLAEQRQGRVQIKIPQRGGAVQLIKMAAKNAAQVFVNQARKDETWRELAVKMQKSLSLQIMPERITCLDISNIGGSQTVGAVVNFRQGEKETAKYRHYKISRADGRPDDYASMAELLERHLKRAAAEDYMPDLLLVDGGKGQLNVARHVLDGLGLEGIVELAGIAKEKGDEGEKIYRPGRKNPLNLAKHSAVLLLFMRIRDEAHRFGITFHRQWRGREAIASPLDRISGIGPARKQAMLKELGSLKRIELAAIEELAKVPGIGPELAKKIWRQLHEKA